MTVLSVKKKKTIMVLFCLFALITSILLRLSSLFLTFRSLFLTQKKYINQTDWIAVSKQQHNSTQISGYGKLNEEQLRILDDVPGSAVELQAKDKVSCSPCH